MAHAYTAEAITHALNCGVRTIEHANLIDLKTAHLATLKGPTSYLPWSLILPWKKMAKTWGFQR